MKLNNLEKSILIDLVKLTINDIQISLSQNDLDNKDLIKKRIEEGDYELEMIIEKLEVLKGIKDKIKITNEPGATIKQLVSLEKTAEKRQKNTQEKIINAINLLELLNKKITVASVSKETSMSFNTVKKYRKVIENREENRVRNQLVS